MYPVRTKGPQQLRREERMRTEMVEAEELLVRLVAGERVGSVRRSVRGYLSMFARNPSGCSDASLRALPVRQSAAAALRVPNLSAAELETFVQVAGQGDIVVKALLEHPNTGYPSKLRAISKRSQMTHGPLDDRVFTWDLSDLPVAAAILVCGALPLEPLHLQEELSHRLLQGGAPAVETFAVLWRDAHRANGMAAQKKDVVKALLDQTLLVLA